MTANVPKEHAASICSGYVTTEVRQVSEMLETVGKFTRHHNSLDRNLKFERREDSNSANSMPPNFNRNVVRKLKFKII